MIDLIKKTLLAGVGAAVLTKEKVEDSLNELVKQGRLSAEEARDAAEKISDQGRREFESVSGDLSRRIQDLMKKAGVGHEDRIAGVEKRLLALEIEVANLVSKPHPEKEH